MMSYTQKNAMLNSKIMREQEKNNRLKKLLANAITLLEDESNINLVECSTRLLEELGMTEKEYKEIIGEN